MTIDAALTFLRELSPILGERLTQHPSWAASLVADPHCIQRIPIATLQNECRQACAVSGDFSIGLRHFKYYALVRLMLRDIQARADVFDILAEWSDVADICLQTAMDIVIPDSSHWALLALGKLGAQELNISSDVDLILLHDNASDAERAALYGREISQLLSTKTAEGFVFRVDWDLRPEGRMGALAPSAHGFVQYYEVRGAAWERLMLLRARHVAGNEQITQRVLSDLRPFIYPRHGSDDIMRACMAMKRDVAAQHAGRSDDVKFCAGGIRDVEFMVHVLQTLHGGRQPALQQLHTIHAITALEEQQLYNATQAQSVRDAYAFLRHVENGIQIIGERHTHRLPQCALQRARIARLCRLPDASDASLQHALQLHCATNSQYFRQLIVDDPAQQRLRRNVHAHVQSAKNDEEALDALSWTKQQRLKQIVTEDLSGQRSFAGICRQLTDLADIMVESVVDIARQDLHTRNLPLAPFAVLGMGSFGARVMDYGSDLDIVCLYAPHSPEENHRYTESMARMSRRVISLLTLPLRYGKLYAVDSDLRPSGRGGVLISNLQAFINYQANEACLWEHQSMIRARPLVAPPELVTQLDAVRIESAFAIRNADPVLREIHRLRKPLRTAVLRSTETIVDLKHCAGGITDVEMMQQAMQLIHGHAIASIRTPCPWDGFAALHAEGIAPNIPWLELGDHYTWLRRFVSHYRLDTQSRTARIKLGSDSFARVSERLALGSVHEVRSSLLERLARIATVYDTLMFTRE